jgi:UDP-N-acetylmuramyl pentapeptide phosphotransferase/UDP-N-acetylglucosamine-1-phosphate transferase
MAGQPRQFHGRHRLDDRCRIRAGDRSNRPARPRRYDRDLALGGAAALLGAILGFAPFNKPVARVFLGDVGSLPIGLVLGWLLLRLAADGHLAAAVILPLYYLADATITLIRRVIRREPFWQAHRQHFYQRATDNGFAVPEIVRRVALVNVALAALAAITVAAEATAVSLAALAWLSRRSPGCS